MSNNFVPIIQLNHASEKFGVRRIAEEAGVTRAQVEDMLSTGKNMIGIIQTPNVMKLNPSVRWKEALVTSDLISGDTKSALGSRKELSMQALQLILEDNTFRSAIAADGWSSITTMFQGNIRNKVRLLVSGSLPIEDLKYLKFEAANTSNKKVHYIVPPMINFFPLKHATIKIQNNLLYLTFSRDTRMSVVTPRGMHIDAEKFVFRLTKDSPNITEVAKLIETLRDQLKIDAGVLNMIYTDIEGFLGN